MSSAGIGTADFFCNIYRFFCWIHRLFVNSTDEPVKSTEMQKEKFTPHPGGGKGANYKIPNEIFTFYCRFGLPIKNK